MRGRGRAVEGSPERLQKILARAGVASRRQAERLIREGRVKVNGRVVRELGVRADPFHDHIRVDGRRIRTAPALYYVFHKPVGVVTTLSDPQGRPCIGDLAQELPARVFPVGRLDVNSAGLLLLTSDGPLAQRLTHPRYKIPKQYRVKVRGLPDEKALGRLRRGIRLEDGLTRPATVVLERTRGKKSWLRVTLTEGRRRQVRRMCETVGHPVEKLVRVQLGPLSLGGLRPGLLRPLAPEDVAALRRAVGLAPRSG